MTIISAGIINADSVTTTLIDSFEDQTISDWRGTTSEWDVVDPSTLGTAWTAPDGTFVARNAAGTGFSRIYANAGDTSVENFFPKGNTARCYTRATALDGQLKALFGLDFASNYYVAEIDYANGAVRIEKLTDSSGSTVRSELAANTTISPSADTTGYLEIVWDDGVSGLGGSDNDISVAYVEGGTELGSVSTNDSEHAAQSGVGLNGDANSTATLFADWFHLRS